MRRGRRTSGRWRAGRLSALAAVLLMVLAPWVARPGAASAAACAMPGMVMAPPAPKPHGCRDAACTAACALCAQLAPATTDSTQTQTRTPTRVRYARLELRLSHMEPERATPPPR